MNKSQLLAILGDDIKRIARETMRDLQGDLRVAGDGLVTGRLNATDYSWDDRELELGWIKDNVIWIYGSSTTFVIYGDDASERFPTGSKLRWKQGGGFLYATVVSATYTSGTTTVTVNGDSVTNADITDNYFSFMATPPGWIGGGTIIEFHPLTTPLTSTNWDGDPYSDVSTPTKIDLSAVFGVPAGVKAVMVFLTARDSGSESNNVLVQLSPNNTPNESPVVLWLEGVPNDKRRSTTQVLPCDSNGDIYYQIEASGTNTTDVWLEIWGYWI